MLALFLKGLIMGVAIAAPVGPISILCIQRSLHDGFKVGFMAGMGAAFADGVYGVIAGFGLTAISTLLITYQNWIRLIGGLFLIYLGIKLLIVKPQERSIHQTPKKSSWHACATTFLLTLANPMTILSFIVIFAGLGLATAQPDYIHAVLLVAGITLGSAIWGLFLSGSVALIPRDRITPNILRVINWISGFIMLGFGIYAIYL